MTDDEHNPDDAETDHEPVRRRDGGAHAESTGGPADVAADRSVETAADGDGPPRSRASAVYGLLGFSTADRVDEDNRRRIREQYGRLRAYYKLRPEKYRDVQRWLDQSRAGTSYDVYLADSARYAVLAALLGAVFGVLVSVTLSNAGLIPAFRNPITTLRGDLIRYLGRNRALFTGAILVILISGLLSAAVWYGRWVYPRTIADARRRNIDVTLPHAITFMYALSYGGMGLLEVIHTIGDAEDTYGQVAAEFEMVARDVELFGNDMFTALRNARNLTPSDNFEQFLDDLLAVLDSGGDVTEFFREETGTYLEDAREEQENFLETLAVMAEFFIVMFVAAPLFLIVILMVISLLGGQTLTQLSLLIYAVLPLGMLGFLVLVDTLSEPYRQPTIVYERTHRQSTGDGVLVLAVLRDAFDDLLALLGSLVGATDEQDSDADRYDAYDSVQRRRRLSEVLDDPFAVVRREPLLTLAVSAPLAALVLAALVVAGYVTPTAEAFTADPLGTTTLAIVLPLLVMLVPVSVFHERQRRRDDSLAKRFPDTLNVLSSANRMGIELTDALALVARWSQGPLAAELRKVRNDIRWNFDTRGALLSFADRIRAPQLSRTLKLIAEGTRATSDLTRVLSVAAEDTRERFKIRRKRQNQLATYVAVVVIGFLVYLLVIVVLDASYLQPIANTPQTPDVPGGSSAPISVATLPVESYRALFFHSALIQGLGIGLLAGKLANDDLLSGLKYSIALVALTLVVFTLL